MDKTTSLRVHLGLMCVHFALTVLALENAHPLLGIVNIVFAVYHGRCIDAVFKEQ